MKITIRATMADGTLVSDAQGDEWAALDHAAIAKLEVVRDGWRVIYQTTDAPFDRRRRHLHHGRPGDTTCWHVIKTAKEVAVVFENFGRGLDRVSVLGFDYQPGVVYRQDACNKSHVFGDFSEEGKSEAYAAAKARKLAASGGVSS